MGRALGRVRSSDWRSVRLREVCQIQLGKMLSPKSKTGTRPRPYLRNANVQWGRFDLQDMAEMDFAEREEAKFALRPGDLLVCEGGEPGRAAVWDGQIVPCYYQKALHRLRPLNRAVDPHFVMYRLWFATLRGEFVDSHAQSTIAHLPAIRLAELPIDIPPLAQQQSIVTVLREQMEAVDRAQVAAKDQLSTADSVPAAYLRALFNGPEAYGWTRVPLGDVCKIVARQVDPTASDFANLPHVSGENIESGTCRFTHLNTAAEDGMMSGKYLFEPGDVLYSKLRPYLRKVAVPDFRGVCSADMYPMRVRQELLDPHFAAWILLSDEFTRYAVEESARARMPKLNRDQLFAWEAPLPALSEQKRITSILADQIGVIARSRRVLQEQLDTINALPVALLRRAFSGEL